MNDISLKTMIKLSVVFYLTHGAITFAGLVLIGLLSSLKG